MKKLITMIILTFHVLSFSQNLSLACSKEKTFDLHFFLRVLPDNGWKLKLKRNSKYEFIHWSGYTGATVLESGSYTFINNQIELKSDKESGELKYRTYFLISSKSIDYDNYKVISCDNNGKPYCLAKKNK